MGDKLKMKSLSYQSIGSPNFKTNTGNKYN